MSRYGPADAAITYNGQLIPDATAITDLKLGALEEEITPIGSAWETHAYVGVKRMPPITVEAPYADDASQLLTTAEAVGVGGTATLLVGFGGTKTSSVSTILKSLSRAIKRGALTLTQVELIPTGTVTEA
jgi:hypothetical protein